MRIIRRCVGEHQLDEAENHCEVIAQDMKGGRIKGDRAARSALCTQFSGRAIIRCDSCAALSVSRHVNVGQRPTPPTS